MSTVQDSTASELRPHPLPLVVFGLDPETRNAAATAEEVSPSASPKSAVRLTGNDRWRG